MLFPGLKSKDESTFPFFVHGQTHDAAGQHPHELFAAGHDPKQGAAEAHRYPQALAFSDNDVRSELTWWRKQAQRERVHRDNEKSPLLMCSPGEGLKVFQTAEEIRMLDQKGRGLVGEGSADLFRNHGTRRSINPAD